MRLGTRGSALAIWQADHVAERLRAAGHEVEIVQFSTKGDRILDTPLAEIGDKGLFTQELDQALLSGDLHLAVHSLKDLPTLPVEGLTLAAIPIREDTADCLISRQGLFFDELAAGSRVGTGSTRRAAQLRAWRSDVQIVEIRGNVDSRLRKLDQGQYDAIVLAKAGLTRLGLLERVTQELPEERVYPAVGQGALGLECRMDDSATVEALSQLNYPPSYAEATAERQLLRSLQAGCLAPVGARATASATCLSLKARVLSLDGRQVIEGAIEGEPVDSAMLGQRLAAQLLDQGAARLIER